MQDLPASERFFAGGDTTVRGFALDRLGDESTISDTGFPKGGNGVIVLNSELRVAVTKRVQGVGFVDAGNVVARASDLDLAVRVATASASAIGSPVGPIRLGPRVQAEPARAAGWTGGAAIWHISLGQAFMLTSVLLVPIIGQAPELVDRTLATFAGRTVTLSDAARHWRSAWLKARRLTRRSCSGWWTAS